MENSEPQLHVKARILRETLAADSLILASFAVRLGFFIQFERCAAQD
jgi:hypothetical protein